MPETRRREAVVDQLSEQMENNNNDNIGNTPEASGFILKLFQMVNGAPSEVITWNKAGDAFIIGYITDLEEKVLPQYFRHNRFQLNFYSFRKINRDRRVWVYKHDLFHRDRPEDLHMVRRRTCPNGVDGRKQRLSRTSARIKPTDNAPAAAVVVATASPTTTDEDESSLEASPPALAKQQEEKEMLDNKPKREVNSKPKQQNLKPKQANKRELEMSPSSDEDNIDTSSFSNKRGRISPPFNAEPIEEKQVVVVTDMWTASSPTEEASFKVSRYTKDMTTTQSPGPVDERAEMAQQSLIVSQVAKKLEKFARKAYGQATTRPRRGDSGIVTPPFGMSRPDSTSLLTYDDEYDYSDDTDEDIVRPAPSVGAITDGDESTSTQDDWATGTKMVTPDKQPKEIVPSKVDHRLAEAIAERIESSKPDSRFSRDHIVAGIVASFAMHVSPVGNKDLTFTMYHLLNNNHELWEDFQLYRAALRPHLGTGKNAQPLNLKQIFTGDAILSDVVRDFKTYTVGCLMRILGKNGDIGIVNQLTEEDREVLGCRANVWRMAVHVAV